LDPGKDVNPRKDHTKVILIAEDEVAMADVLAATLEQPGLRTVLTYDGEEALSLARALHPNLVLLDVMMPKCSGFEVCATLKKDPLTSDIPVVLLTAKTSKRDREHGLAVGADHYLTKPFSPTTLIALVDEILAGQPPVTSTARLDHASEDQLVVYANELRTLFEQERIEREALANANERLEELDQLKSSFLESVTHELLTPFSRLGFHLQILQKQCDILTPAMAEVVDDLTEVVVDLHRKVEGVVKFAELVNKRRRPQFGYYQPYKLVPWAVQPIATMAQARDIDFRVLIPNDLPKIRVDPDLLSEALFQIAHNAVKFNARGGEIRITAEADQGGVLISVADTGLGLTSEQIEALGRPFEQNVEALRVGETGLGIGWALVCYVTGVHDGQTSVESPGPNQGSIFSIWLPAAEKT